MPLDISFIERSFEDNPDPEKLRQFLIRAKEVFLHSIAEYVDENNQIKGPEPIPEGTMGLNSILQMPLANVLMRINAYRTNIESLGWPKDQMQLLNEFIIELYTSVGLNKKEGWLGH